MQARSSRCPGSEMPGMPASVMMATFSPWPSRAEQFGGAARFVVLVVADERLADPEMLEQVQRMAGILAGDHVRLLQDIDGAQGDIGQVADGSGDEVEHPEF